MHRFRVYLFRGRRIILVRPTAEPIPRRREGEAFYVCRELSAGDRPMHTLIAGARELQPTPFVAVVGGVR